MYKLRKVALFTVEVAGAIIFFLGILLIVSAFGFGMMFLPIGNELFSGFIGLLISLIGVSIADGAKELNIFKKKEVKN